MNTHLPKLNNPDFLTQHKQQTLDEIRKARKADVNNIISEAKLKPLTFFFNNITYEIIENNPKYTKAKFFIPYQGKPELLLNFPDNDITITKDNLQFDFIFWQNSNDQSHLINKINYISTEINHYQTNLTQEIAQFNENLELEAKIITQNRFSILERDTDILKQLGIKPK